MNDARLLLFTSLTGRRLAALALSCTATAVLAAAQESMEEYYAVPYNAGVAGTGTTAAEPKVEDAKALVRGMDFTSFKVTLGAEHVVLDGSSTTDPFDGVWVAALPAGSSLGVRQMSLGHAFNQGWPAVIATDALAGSLTLRDLRVKMRRTDSVRLAHVAAGGRVLLERVAFASGSDAEGHGDIVIQRLDAGAAVEVVDCQLLPSAYEPLAAARGFVIIGGPALPAISGSLVLRGVSATAPQGVSGGPSALAVESPISGATLTVTDTNLTAKGAPALALRGRVDGASVMSVTGGSRLVSESHDAVSLTTELAGAAKLLVRDAWLSGAARALAIDGVMADTAAVEIDAATLATGGQTHPVVGAGGIRAVAALSVGPMASTAAVVVTDTTVVAPTQPPLGGFLPTRQHFVGAVALAGAVGSLTLRRVTLDLRQALRENPDGPEANADVTDPLVVGAVGFGVANASDDGRWVLRGLELSGVDVLTPNQSDVSIFPRPRSRAGPGPLHYWQYLVPEVRPLWIGAAGSIAVEPDGATLCISGATVGGEPLLWGDLPGALQVPDSYDARRSECMTLVPTVAPTPTLAPTPPPAAAPSGSSGGGAEPGAPDAPKRRGAADTLEEVLPPPVAAGLPWVSAALPIVARNPVAGPLAVRVSRIGSCDAADNDTPAGDWLLGVPPCAAVGGGANRCLWVPLLIATLAPLVAATVPHLLLLRLAPQRLRVRKLVAPLGLLVGGFYLPTAAGLAVSVMQNAAGAGELAIGVLALVMSVAPAAAAAALLHLRWPTGCAAYDDPAVAASPWLPALAAADGYREPGQLVLRFAFFSELAAGYVVAVADGYRPAGGGGVAACAAPASLMLLACGGLFFFFIGAKPHEARRDLGAAAVLAALMVVAVLLSFFASAEAFAAAKQVAAVAALVVNAAVVAQLLVSAYGLAATAVEHCRGGGAPKELVAGDLECGDLVVPGCRISPPPPGPGSASPDTERLVSHPAEQPRSPWARGLTPRERPVASPSSAKYLGGPPGLDPAVLRLDGGASPGATSPALSPQRQLALGSPVAVRPGGARSLSQALAERLGASQAPSRAGSPLPPPGSDFDAVALEAATPLSRRSPAPVSLLMSPDSGAVVAI